MKKKKTMSSSQVFGLVQLILGVGLEGIIFTIASLTGFDAFFQTTIGTLFLISSSFLIFLGVMFLVFKRQENEFA